MILHHDHEAVEIDDSHINLMRSFQLWVETVRKTPGNSPLWEPSDIDIIKSRLFWRIRSGHQPLAWAPPKAYSCPWYEVVEDMGNHSCFECWRGQDDRMYGLEHWIIAQCAYDHIEERENNQHIVGYGEYRFLIFRDVAMEAKRIAALNPHSPDCEERMLESMKDQASRGWFIRRLPELEIPQPEVELAPWAKQLKPHMSPPL
jgi:hypothetical protein